MAFTEFYCNASTGSNMNGGSDENASPSYSATNGGFNSGTGVFTPTSGDPSASVTVGEFANVFTDGATTPVFVGRVTAVSSTTVTVSTSAKSGTAPGTGASGISINVGGVWKGPNGAVAFPFGFVTNALKDASANIPRVNLKNNATYSITAAMTHSNAGTVNFEGYTTTAGDGGRATIDGGTSGASYVLLTASGTKTKLSNLIFQNNGATGSANGIVISGAASIVRGVVVNSVRGQGIHITANSTIHECECYACNQSNTAGTGGINIQANNVCVFDCVLHDNTGSNSSGLIVTFPGTVYGCICESNGQYGIYCQSSLGELIEACTLYNNTSDGIHITGSAASAVVENCLFISNGGYGLNANPSSPVDLVDALGCAYYSNTSGQTNGRVTSSGSITLTGDPFTDAANGDFRLNATAGAGDDCRGAGIGTFTQTAASYSGTVGYPDVGAAQHQDAGGGTQLIVGTLGARSIGTY